MEIEQFIKENGYKEVEREKRHSAMQYSKEVIEHYCKEKGWRIWVK